MPIWVGSTELIVDVLGGIFWAFEPPRGVAGLAPGLRSASAIARGDALAIASTERGKAVSR